MTRRTALRATNGALVILAASVAASEETARRRMTMEIKRSGSEASRRGPADWFTGSVRIDPLFQAPEPARVTGAHVSSPVRAQPGIRIRSARL